MSQPFDGPNVERAFAAFSNDVREGLLFLRALIFDPAARTRGVGRLEETLKWGKLAYLTSETKAGSPSRLRCPKSGGFAIYVHCQTSIVSDFRALFPNEFYYEGNRAMNLRAAESFPTEKLRFFITSALTYHLR